MSFKPLSKFYFTILLTSISFFGLAQTKEKDPLNKRVFNMSLAEMKDGVAQKKLLKDVMEFKNGKLFSELLNEKFGYKWIKYRIEKDSSLPIQLILKCAIYKLKQVLQMNPIKR